MKLKISRSKRETYRLFVENGELVTGYRSEKDRVTEVDITNLYKTNDHKEIGEKSSGEKITMGERMKPESKTLKSPKREVAFGKVQAFLEDKLRQGYIGKVKELLRKYSMDILFGVVISACDDQGLGGKIMAELFAFETVKLIVIHVAYRLIWVCIFMIWGYTVVSICQRIWHKVRKFIKYIKN